MHSDELEIADQVVRRLVERDLPRLSDRPMRRLAGPGSTNALFRLGDEHLIRIPRQPGGSRSIEKEARWLPQMAAMLPVPVPEVIAKGEPGFGYPEQWVVTRWIDGQSPRTPEPAGAAANALARDLAAFLTALHGTEVPDQAATDADLRSYRSGPLLGIDSEVRQYLEKCRRLPDLQFDVDAGLDLWAQAVARPGSENTARWVHGDLLAENLLVRDGRLTAVLDFGALAVGDPSVDLIVGWEVLGASAREVFRSNLAVDEPTWLRGRAWALAIAAMTFPYYWTSMPTRCSARLAMAQQVLADPSS